MKLSITQEILLQKLEQQRAAYDKRAEELERDYRYKRDTLKQEIREGVKHALEIGIPQRRIHLALGFAQVGQLKEFMRPVAERINDSLVDVLALSIPVEDEPQGEYTSRDNGKNSWLVVTPDAKVYRYDAYGYDIYIWAPADALTPELEDYLKEQVDYEPAVVNITRNEYDLMHKNLND